MTIVKQIDSDVPVAPSISAHVQWVHSNAERKDVEPWCVVRAAIAAQCVDLH